MKVNKFVIIFLSIALVGLIAFVGFKGKPAMISFDTDGGNEIKAIVVNDDGTFVLPDNPVKEGYFFDGWFLNDEKFNKDTKVVKDIKLKAKWVQIDKNKTITVSFDSNGGTYVNDIYLYLGEPLKLPEDPVKNGYEFISWQDENDVDVSDGVILSRDTTLTAYYMKDISKPPFSVRPNYDDNTNNGSINTTPVEIEYYCFDGYTLDGMKCTKVETKKSIKNVKCPSGSISYYDKCVNLNDSKPLVMGCRKKDGSKGAFIPSINTCFYGLPVNEEGKPFDKDGCEAAGYYFYKTEEVSDELIDIKPSNQKEDNIDEKPDIKPDDTPGDIPSDNPVEQEIKGICYSKMVEYDPFDPYRDGTPKLVCEDDGYVKYYSKNSKDICVREVKPVGVFYSCSNGYTLVGDHCEKTITVNARIKK